MSKEKINTCQVAIPRDVMERVRIYVSNRNIKQPTEKRLKLKDVIEEALLAFVGEDGMGGK